MTLRVDQLLAGFADGDAISQAALAMRDVLRGGGLESDIYAEPRHTSPTLRGVARDVAAYRPGDAVLHHYSIGSPVVNQFVGAATKRVLVYHNITPDSYFAPYDTAVAASLREARRQLGLVARQVDAVWAVSEFNAAELRALGCPDVQVFPLVFDRRTMDVAEAPEIRGRLAGPLTTYMAVGRLAPNKRLEMLIKAFHFLVRGLNPYSRLVLIGSRDSCPRYVDMLQMLVSDLDIPNVCFEGFAAPEALATYYRCADVVVSTSDHEGYCLPLLEAMHHEAVVVAHRVGGMPEAMGGAGVLYEGLDAAGLAALLHRVAADGGLRASILNGQRRRMASLEARPVEQELLALVRRVVPA